MSVLLEERPRELQAAGSGNGPARRAIVRWSWRLFRREWRQQLLVLALVLFSVAATTVGVGLAYNAGQPQDASFGSANSMMTFSGNDRADVTAAQRAFGTLDEIDDQQIAIPGSLATVDLRAEDPNGKYARPTLRLVQGSYPSGPDEIAPTKNAAATLGLRVGGTSVLDGRSRRVVGLVENPLDLNDQFALVAPGQANPPNSITILFNASRNQINNFQPSGNATSIGTRSSLNKSTAALVVLVLETIALLFVGLVAAAGFAVMAQRRLRALGMLGALGATNRHVRLAMVANGAVVGAVGAATGMVTGLVAWIALASYFESLVRHRFGRFHLPWWALAAAMLLAVLTSVAAAWWPARAAARASIVTALSGRPAPPKPAHRFAGAGAVMLAVGVLCLAFSHRNQNSPNSLLTVAGIVTTTLGMLFLGPVFIRMLAVVGRRAPIALRLALRDLARYQARSAAALGAISLALAIAATVAISAAASATPASQANLASNQMMVYPSPSNGAQFDDGVLGIPQRTPAEADALQRRVDSLAAAFHAQAFIPLTAAIDPAAGVFPAGPPGANSDATDEVPVAFDKVERFVRSGHLQGIQITDNTSLYVATPALLRFFGINAGSIDPGTDVISGTHGLKGFTVVAQQGGPTPCDASQPKCRVNGVKPTGPPALRGPDQWHPVIQTLPLPTFRSAPDTLLTSQALHAFGLKPIAAGWLIQTRSPLTASQITTAQSAAAAAGFTVETRKAQLSQARLRDIATAIGLLVALAVLAMTVGLIRSETANDLRTLTATGATSTTRRTLTGATAGALALLGAVLGTGGAYVALIAWHRSDLHPLTQVPVLDLVLVLVGLPAIAIIGGWLLAGREPATIGHQPLE